MDVVKTLLVYMTVLLTSSAALSPGLTPLPAPTYTPVPVVTAAPVQPQTPFPAPSPQQSPTATPQLTTVRMNDRGQNVRNLQTRLKELGYLAGDVDGAFGRDTLAAVQAFQRANSLEADGIAGQKTLSKLYFDDQVVWSPHAGSTPSPSPSPSPTPALGSLPVYYLGPQGERLYTEVLTLYQGRTTIRANSQQVPAGFELIGVNQVTVTVSENGSPSPQSVTFTYQKLATAPEVTATLVVNYLDEGNDASFHQESLTLPLGITQVYANDHLVPEGYALTSVRSVDVTVDAAGQADPATIGFVYRKVPVFVQVPVHYVDDAGQALYQDLLTLDPGSHDILANGGYVPLGYSLQGNNLQQVVVNQQGQASPAALTFVYVPPQGAQVQVSYLDMNGGILHEETLTLPQGSHPVEAQQDKVPEGYVLQGLSTITVLVDLNGIALPPAVTFHYLSPTAPAPQEEPQQTQTTPPAASPEVTGQATAAPDETAQTAPASETTQGTDETTASDEALQAAETDTTALPVASMAAPGTSDEDTTPVENADTTTALAEDATTPETTGTGDGATADSPAAVPEITLTEETATADTPAAAPEITMTEETATAEATATTQTAQNEPAMDQNLSQVPYLPPYQTLRFAPGSYPVYTGPGDDYYQVQDATLTGGDCRLYGSVGEWLLMGYGTAEGGYRIGYITRDALPQGKEAQELILAQAPMTLLGAAQLTDDPVVNLTFFATLQKDSQLTLLAYLDDNSPFAYVEVADVEGKTARGFVDLRLLP